MTNRETMKRNLRTALVLAAIAGLVGFLVATITAEPRGSFRQDTGPAAVFEQVDLKALAGARYEYPADVQAARRACFQAEREARNIPGTDAAYRAWWTANEGTPAELDWSAAYDACKERHNVVGTRWSAEWYANLVRVN